MYTSITHQSQDLKAQAWVKVAMMLQAAIKVAHQLVTQRGQRKKGQHHYHRYTVGDLVWLKGVNLKLTHPKAKLDAKRYGPFHVTKEVSRFDRTLCSM
jgi:hypothetical protein